MKILVIERDPYIRELMECILREDNHIPFTTSCPMEALGIFEAERPEVVLADFHLPKIEGICQKELIAKIKKSSKLFIVFNCPLSSPKETARRYGADMAFGKPFIILDILKHVNA